MQPQLALYIASVAGAVSLYLLMPKPGKDLRLIGGVLGAATLGLLWLLLVPLTLGDPERGLPHLNTGFGDGQTPFYYVFSFLAIAAAVRVITHHRPVYSALWFVMVVIASAGLLLTLSAEFMAFAMLIIYGGAILVTYMFVIMLATPPRSDADDEEGPAYDRLASEPLWACVAGFLLLAVILSVSFRPMVPNVAAAVESDEVIIAGIFADRGVEYSALATPAGGIDEVMNLTNVEHVGLDLFRSHPLAIELAGIILLLALIGAVVIAKTQVVPLDEPVNEPADPPDVAPQGAPG
jgi:NADH-quinone oxidoreductase subunit J